MAARKKNKDPRVTKLNKKQGKAAHELWKLVSPDKLVFRPATTEEIVARSRLALQRIQQGVEKHFIHIGNFSGTFILPLGGDDGDGGITFELIDVDVEISPSGKDIYLEEGLHLSPELRAVLTEHCSRKFAAEIERVISAFATAVEEMPIAAIVEPAEGLSPEPVEGLLEALAGDPVAAQHFEETGELPVVATVEPEAAAAGASGDNPY